MRLAVAFLVSLLIPFLALGTRLAFEPDGRAYVLRTPKETMEVTERGIKFGRGAAMRLLRAADARAVASEPLFSHSSYFLGSDASRWRTNVPHYARVRYRSVYPGIDVVYYGTNGKLEYDFVVAPGADPSFIELMFDGVDRILLRPDGSLRVKTGQRAFTQHAPRVYQFVDGNRKQIAGGYRVQGNRVHFTLGDYDHRAELVIDPVLQFAAYFGDSGYDAATSIAIDSSGATYLSGVTTSAQLKTTNDSAQRDQGGASDAFVAKFSSFGDLLWVSYFGGKGTEAALGLAIDGGGNAVISGFSTSQNLPVRNAFQSSFGGGELDAFVAKISANGNQLLFATYLGGSGDDYGNGVALDAQGNTYLTGWTRSPDFPVRGGYQQGPAGGGGDTFVAKFAPSGQSLLYSTFVGGNGDDLATGIAVDQEGSAYVTGKTTSTVFPLANPIQRTNGGNYDVFAYKLNAAGNSLLYSTLLGGSAEDSAQRIAVDAQGAAYITGDTKSPNFPVRNGAQMASGGGADAFVLKLTPSGDALVYSTLLGGTGDDFAFGISVDAGGSAYVSGWTNSQTLPLRSPTQPTNGGGSYDGFVARLSPDGGTWLYTTYLGGSGEDQVYGITLDRSGMMHISGRTDSTNLPRAGNTLAPGLKTADAFFATLSADASTNLLAVSRGELAFTLSAGAADPPPVTIAVSSTGQAVNFTAGASASWIKVSPDRGISGTGVTVTISAQGLGAGTYREEVTINAPGASNSPIRIPVTLTITLDPPILTPASVVNAASFLTGALAPGEIITVFGSGFGAPLDGSIGFNNALPRQLGDTRLIIDEVAVPLLSVRPGQVTAIVPYSVASKTQVLLQVDAAGRRSAAISLLVAPATPALFTATMSGAGQAVAYNENGSVNSVDNPAAPGSIMVFYGTGEGTLRGVQVEGTPASGTPVPTQPIRVRIGGVDAEVIYFGPIPGAVPGVFQLNVKIPGELTSGTVPVSVNVGGATAPVVTVAVSLRLNI